MTRRMLINGRYAEELRMAIAVDHVLESYKVEMAQGGVARGNVYRGVVANIEPSLDAAFIDFGEEKHGFLARHDLIPEAQHRQGDASRIEQVLERGRPVLVQVTRDAVAQKGAVLTTNISLAGRYLVLMPFDTAHGMSRKVEDETVRKSLKQKVNSLVAEGYGFIVRTNAVDQTKTALKHDLDQLVRLWKKILAARDEGKGPRLLHNDQDLIVQALRDHLDSEIEEIVIDDERLLARAEEYLNEAMPKRTCTVIAYREKIPLFSRYNLEPQVAAVYRRTVPLAGGGSIVIDPTEALTAIDVNSGKSTGAGSQEETAYATNREAAAEVARQLRLRDIGGLVVVDFIDMRSPKQRREIERVVKEGMKRDKARSHIGHISANGLLEINRQRIQQAIGVRAHRLCPSCQGSGRLISTELHGLHLLRRLEAGAATGRMRRARVSLHPALAEVVQNRRRGQIAALEAALRIEVEILGDPLLAPGEERIQWTEREVAPAEKEAREAAEQPRQAAAPPQRQGTKPEPRKERERGRSRRGRREKKPAGETAAEAPARAPAAERAAPPAGVEEVAAPQPAPERPPAIEALPAEPVGEAAALQARAPSEGPAAVAGNGEPGRSRRRRRRGRRPPGEAQQGAAPAPAERRPVEVEPVEQKAAAGEESRRRRRRRGGRRRKGSAGGASPPTPQS